MSWEDLSLEDLRSHIVSVRHWVAEMEEPLSWLKTVSQAANQTVTQPSCLAAQSEDNRHPTSDDYSSAECQLYNVLAEVEHLRQTYDVCTEAPGADLRLETHSTVAPEEKAGQDSDARQDAEERPATIASLINQPLSTPASMMFSKNDGNEIHSHCVSGDVAVNVEAAVPSHLMQNALAPRGDLAALACPNHRRSVDSVLPQHAIQLPRLLGRSPSAAGCLQDNSNNCLRGINQKAKMDVDLFRNRPQTRLARSECQSRSPSPCSTGATGNSLCWQDISRRATGNTMMCSPMPRVVSQRTLPRQSTVNTIVCSPRQSSPPRVVTQIIRNPTSCGTSCGDNTSTLSFYGRGNAQPSASRVVVHRQPQASRDAHSPSKRRLICMSPRAKSPTNQHATARHAPLRKASSAVSIHQGSALPESVLPCRRSTDVLSTARGALCGAASRSLSPQDSKQHSRSSGALPSCLKPAGFGL